MNRWEYILFYHPFLHQIYLYCWLQVSMILIFLKFIHIMNYDHTFILQTFQVRNTRLWLRALLLCIAIVCYYCVLLLCVTCSVLSFPVLAVMAGVFGEYSAAMSYDRYKEIGFLLMISLLLVMGSFLNFTLFLCNRLVIGLLISISHVVLWLIDDNSNNLLYMYVSKCFSFVQTRY